MRVDLFDALSALTLVFLTIPSTLADYPAKEDPSSLVNLFIGTINGGHVFPGATVPHGLVKVGMDTDAPGNHAGYDGSPEYNVTGFSQLHDDGTGGAVPLSNFKLWPFAECSNFEGCPTRLNSRKVLRKVLDNGLPDDHAEPGYFSTNLSTDIRVELTSTRRTALHRYTFPASSKQPRIALDLVNDGQLSSTYPDLDIDPDTGRVSGGAEFAASFGPGRYKAYVCADFRHDSVATGNATTPAEYGAWLYDFPIKYTVRPQQVYYGFVSELGSLLTFDPAPSGPTTILARVGVSFISAAQACTNAEEEIPNFDFEDTRTASRKAWNDILGRIQVDDKDVDRETVSLLYSSVYRTHLSPADYTGENPHWNSTEPYYDSLYCNWDTYRTLYPLYSLHDPENFARIVRGMINVQQHEGWLPECRGATAQHFIQGGSNGDPILAELAVKYDVAKLNVSKAHLYEALLADAEKQPPNWDLQGRQANVWKKLGYVPQDVYERSGTNTKQVSRALEYAFDDFTISQVARHLGHKTDAVKYAGRARNFVNHWNADIHGNVNITGVPGAPKSLRGMAQPRFANGTFGYTDPRHCSVNDPQKATCYLNAANHDGFYESSPIVYSQYVPHDTAKLIELQGGPHAFTERLDWIFEEEYFDSTNEPAQQIPFMYHYVNKPGLSTQRSRQVIAQFFNTSRNGLPGNDDSGAMGSYVAFYLAGLYPLPGTRQILLSSPYFREISFYNPLYKSTTTIRSTNFVGNPKDGTGGWVFVKSVKVDGKPWKSNCYLDWSVFENGSTVELELTDDIGVSCGKGKDALPPSLSTGGYD